MVSQPRTTTVQILGQEYRIRTDEAPEFVQEVARYVDETLRSLASRMASGSPTQIAVLGALNIAEELFRERRGGNGRDVSEWEDRLRGILGRLEQVAPEKPVRVPRAAVARAGARE